MKPLSPVERSLVRATAALLLASGVLHVGLRGTSPAREGRLELLTDAPAAAPRSPSSLPPVRLRAAPAGVAPVRAPTVAELESPERSRALLKRHLAAEAVRWDWVGALVEAAAAPLDAEVLDRLLRELLEGDAPGVLPVFGRIGDEAILSRIYDALGAKDLADGARADLLSALCVVPVGDRDDIVRAIAAQMNGEAGRDRSCLRSIARRGGPEASRFLVEVARSLPDAAGWFTDLVGQLDLRDDPASAVPLARAIADASLAPERRAALIDLVAGPFPPNLLTALLDGDGADTPPEVRSRLLAGLARSGEVAAVDQLLADTTDEIVRETALRSLSDCRRLTPESTARLVEHAQGARDLEVLRACAKAFGANAVDVAVPLLVEWTSSRDSALQRQAVASLGQIGVHADAATSALEAAFERGDRTLRLGVVVALGDIATPAARDSLRKLAARADSALLRDTIAMVLAREPTGR